MTECGRLYEPAAKVGGLGPFWHLDQTRTLFVGPLQHNGLHQHGAPVYLAGLYGSFELRLEGADWRRCRGAVIPAGYRHELRVHGQPIAVFYIEPGVDGIGSLTTLLGEVREVEGALTGRPHGGNLLRELWEDRRGPQWAGQALDDLLTFARPRVRRQPDARVARIMADLGLPTGTPVPVAQLATSVGLSASRLQHLFTREAGVPLRRYRAWRRMRTAIDAITGGDNFTTAAHAAGFSDQAHFNHDFRRTFGAPPSVSLARLRPGIGDP
ncbi:MAG: AraC family transcriptional regulator [Salinisphaeraceae bacterium]